MAPEKPSKMSDKVYLLNKGKCCPDCYSTDIHEVALDFTQSNIIEKEMTCNQCNFLWAEIYVLAEYKEMEQPVA